MFNIILTITIFIIFVINFYNSAGIILKNFKMIPNWELINNSKE
jgi:hypothetical protein